MITIQTADNALKSFYLDAVTEALDLKANPLLAQMQKTSANVVGKDVKKLVRLGMSGGVSAGTETGALPTASEAEKVVFTSTLKNLYGTIEISDKALRASANDEGAFVNILNDEMQTLIKSASLNFGRMLYGDGTAKIAGVSGIDTVNTLALDSLKYVVEGMLVDFYVQDGTPIEGARGVKVLCVKHGEDTVVFDRNIGDIVTPGNYMYVHDSMDNEITGLGAIFGDDNLYGVDRTNKYLLKPYKKTAVGEISESVIQKAIDSIEERSGEKVNFIVCSWGVKRALAEYYREFKVMMPSVELAGGYKAVTFNGIPVVADRFCPNGTMYLLNTDAFKINQLCDWKWLEGEDGKILKQVPNKPVYTATLVKYAELMCEKPSAQGMLSGIIEK